MPTTENSAELIAEARRRTPSLTDSQWLAWLAQVAAMGGQLTLTLDGCCAVYPRPPATVAGS
jgi:hypothetical protein